MKLATRTRIFGAAITAVLCVAALAAVTAAGDPGHQPLPLETPASEWTTLDGREIVSLTPARGGVLSMDGKPLRDSNGALVTVPPGDAVRGAVSHNSAADPVDRAMLIQARDACERGVPTPVTGVAAGDMPIEEAVAQSQKNLERAIAANGGSVWRDPCDALKELQMEAVTRP